MRSAPATAGRGRHRGADLVGLGRHRHLRLRQPLAERCAEPTDERAVVEHVLGRQALDIDVDAVQSESLHELDEDLDPASLGVGFGVELAVLARAETRVNELDPAPAGLRFGDQALAERSVDAPDAVLVVVERPVPVMGDREQGERRELDRRQVLGDRVVHLPVGHEPVRLVAGDRDDRRARGRLARLRGPIGREPVERRTPETTRQEHDARRQRERAGHASATGRIRR